MSCIIMLISMFPLTNLNLIWFLNKQKSPHKKVPWPICVFLAVRQHCTIVLPMLKQRIFIIWTKQNFLQYLYSMSCLLHLHPQTHWNSLGEKEEYILRKHKYENKCFLNGCCSWMVWYSPTLRIWIVNISESLLHTCLWIRIWKKY